MVRDMPGQSGLNEINAGNTATNHGKACDELPQVSRVVVLTEYWMVVAIIIEKTKNVVSNLH